jgi:hypothetical protein
VLNKGATLKHIGNFEVNIVFGGAATILKYMVRP